MLLIYLLKTSSFAVSESTAKDVVCKRMNNNKCDKLTITIGDEDHLDKYIHSCKFGQRCKKIDDPVHLKRFIHVLPGSLPPVSSVAFTPGGGGGRGPRGGRIFCKAFPKPFSCAFPHTSSFSRAMLSHAFFLFCFLLCFLFSFDFT